MNSGFSKSIEEFFSQYKLRSYERGDLILHADDIPNGVYFLKSGFVKLYSDSPEGKELIRYILGPTDLFPIRWTFSNEPIDFYLEPLTDILCWYAPREDFLDFLHKNPDLLLEMTVYSVKRMGTLYKRMEFLAFGDAYQKTTAILVYLAKYFGKYDQNKEVILELPITQKDIGALVGLSRETVNEEIEKLRQAGLIETTNRQIIIKDLQKLDDEASLFDL